MSDDEVFDATEQSDNNEGLKVYFNPFAFTIEQNNEFLRRGYEPTPIQVPDTTTTHRLDDR